MRPSLTQLAQFAAVVEERSFTRASARLKVAQPWLSTRIRELEELVGFRLLDRTPRGVSLTAEGERYHIGVVALLRKAEGLSTLAASIADAAGDLRLGAIPDSFHIPERNQLIDAYRSANPDVSIRLENHADPELRQMVLTGRLDAAFVSGLPPTKCESVMVRAGRAQLLLPSGHPLSAHAKVPTEAVCGIRIGAFPRDRNPVAWDATVGRLARAGALIVPMEESLRQALVAQAARESLALLVLSSFDDAAPDRHGMELRLLVDPSITADFCLIRRKRRMQPRTMERLWTLAQKVDVAT